MMPRAVLRLIDANANRALEGLRVCEEIIRFHAEVPALFRRLRALRHALAAAIRALPVGPVALVRARDSRRDVGRRAPAASVSSLQHLALINFQRAKESLRVLEECARLAHPTHVVAFQRLRFRVYDAERALLLRVEALRHRGSRRRRRSPAD